MTLTKKELMTAVKLCSDVAVQRGLPNMRIRPKSHVHYNVRPPFHAHHKKHQPSLTLNNGLSPSSVMSGKGRVVSTPLVHIPNNSKGNFDFIVLLRGAIYFCCTTINKDKWLNYFSHLKQNTFKYRQKRLRLVHQLRLKMYRMMAQIIFKLTVRII